MEGAYNSDVEQPTDLYLPNILHWIPRTTSEIACCERVIVIHNFLELLSMILVQSNLVVTRSLFYMYQNSLQDPDCMNDSISFVYSLIRSNSY